jgi:hypothetical protein
LAVLASWTASQKGSAEGKGGKEDILIKPSEWHILQDECWITQLAR